MPSTPPPDPSTDIHDGWAKLTTESRHPESADLDRMPSEAAVRLLLSEDQRGIEKTLEVSAAIAFAAERIAETLRAGADVILVGAGTSGRLGVLEAAECPPTFGTDPRRIRAEIAGGHPAVFRAQEGAEDRREDGHAVVEGLREEDLVIGISASSVTPFVHGAIEAARERGLFTILLTCGAPGHVADVADHTIALDTGPEVLTGSTRLKAGSATKAALNAMTTTAMVRLGKTYRNWMVDLRPGSAKLVDRSRRIVEAAVGVAGSEAADLLEAAGGEVKTAIVAGLLGVAPEEARRRLDREAGRVHRAIAEGSGPDPS